MGYHADLSTRDGQFLPGTASPVAPVSPARRLRGSLAYQAGAMAEESVARQLSDAGMAVLARRWRGKAGEIDIICRDGDCVVFVEVKQAATHGDAAERLARPQMDRICAAACEYCSELPTGLLTEMRFDVAMVDAVGRVEILQNAFGEG